MIDKSKVSSLVFNLYDDSAGIARKLADGLHTRIFLGDRSMLSIARIEPHTKGTIHSHSEGAIILDMFAPPRSAYLSSDLGFGDALAGQSQVLVDAQ